MCPILGWTLELRKVVLSPLLLHADDLVVLAESAADLQTALDAVCHCTGDSDGDTHSALGQRNLSS